MSRGVSIFTGNLSEFTDAIQSRKNEGYELVDIEYGDGVWFGIFQPSSGSRNAYTSETNYDDFLNSVNVKWNNEGMDLVDIEYGDGTWFGVFQDKPGYSGFGGGYSLGVFANAIQERWNQGYQLVDVENIDGYWFGVFHQSDGTTNAYVAETSLDQFKNSVQYRLNQSTDLIGVEYDERDGTWFGVHKYRLGLNSYNTANSFDEFINVANSNWYQGYDLVDVEYGDGIWFGVFEKSVSPNELINYTKNELNLGSDISTFNYFVFGNSW